MRFLLIFFCFFNVTILYAQYVEKPQDFRFVEIKGHSGLHLYNGEELKEALENGYGAIELRYGWQSNNSSSWQSLFGYPAYGIGWYSGFIGNPDLLGTPGAVYGFISFPVSKPRRNLWVLETALGISYDLKPYNSETNINNDAIGSRFNVYFNLNLGANYQLNREIDLVYGIDITHFSNGRMFKPNAGLNMYGLNLGFKYHFNTQQRYIDNRKFPEHILNVRPQPMPYRKAKPIKDLEVLLYVATGLVQNDENSGTSKQYSTITSMIEASYIVNEISSLAIGMDVFYDSSLAMYYPNNSHWFYGVHGGYDLNFWKLAIRLQGGTYLHNRARKFKGDYFLRPALKYQLSKDIFTQIGLKTQDGFKADWIEFGLGIKIFNK